MPLCFSYLHFILNESPSRSHLNSDREWAIHALAPIINSVEFPCLKWFISVKVKPRLSTRSKLLIIHVCICWNLSYCVHDENLTSLHFVHCIYSDRGIVVIYVFLCLYHGLPSFYHYIPWISTSTSCYNIMYMLGLNIL